MAASRLKQFCLKLRFKSTQLFIVAGAVLLSLLVTLLCIGLTIRYEVEHEVANVADVDYWKDQVSAAQKVWYDKGIEELKQALRIYSPQTQPRQVLLLLISGISAETLAAARFEREKHAPFVWDQFPHVARIKNSCSSRSPCDANLVYRSLFSGVPLNEVVNQPCNHTLHSVLRQAQLAGLRTGFVTNQRITGAAASALVVSSSWECDGLMPAGVIDSGCQDVAQQLIFSEAGQALNVLLGGGRQLLSAKVPVYDWDPLDEQLCRARSGRNLLRDWRNQKLKLQPKQRFELLQLATELSTLNATNLDYLWGVLANANLHQNSQAPSLDLMLNKTLEVLQRPGVGHLLIVEHVLQQAVDATQQLRQLNETLSNFMQQQKNTLTLVLFTNGNYLSSSRDVSEETGNINLLEEFFELTEVELQLQMQKLPSESLLFAKGPKSLLFYGVHEETYLAHALAYALGLNDFDNQL
ncbi:alkaline phosphatase [Drosophila sulfurigaster albostrigata]|uniref:alkaline phosphatase n=1 Tax=Drosophila sulfurigaster albostrigata TaxID=89887 RepID=UPI002D219511|nr:alkaline phosphatase [Drosophila sulfurigaster albostrigata]XP_062125405.1 alkaline phosphatase [Drosophila sulfurigaster albostrigata]XP_062125406.1 alkaline phosphatase [Drosophila sulfurigaster albostrigata]